jgi:hypothetical protein
VLGKLPANQRAGQESDQSTTQRPTYQSAGTATSTIRVGAKPVAEPAQEGARCERTDDSTLLPVGGPDLSGHSIALFPDERTWGEG